MKMSFLMLAAVYSLVEEPNSLPPGVAKELLDWGLIEQNGETPFGKVPLYSPSADGLAVLGSATLDAELPAAVIERVAKAWPAERVAKAKAKNDELLEAMRSGDRERTAKILAEGEDP